MANNIINKDDKKKVDGKFMKIELVGIFVFLFIFVVSVMVIFVVTGGMEPSTLIVSVFGFCGLEGGILGWIKTTKEKKALEDKKKAEEEAKEKNDEVIMPLYPEENLYNEDTNEKYRNGD